MKNFLFLILFVLLACQFKNQFLISGYLADKKYDGEFIYLVPFENATKETVDSAVIKNGHFEFRGKIIHSDVCILRTRPLLRLSIEELLIVREPGNLTVKLDKSSSVQGTPLNDSLQYWKERKMRYDFVNAELIKRFHESKDEPEKQILKAKQDSLLVLSNKFHFSFVMGNKDNIVGQFIQKVMSGSFTEEQRQMLKSLPSGISTP